VKSSVYGVKAEGGKPMGFQQPVKFIQFNLAKLDRKEIPRATVRNYLNSIKLFCEMDDIL
jgi:hypothetical protein